MEIDTRMGNMFTEPNAKYDIVASHIRKIDVQLAQTAESVKRQQGTLPGKTDKNPRTEHSIAPSEPAETPPVRDYVPKVPYPIPPKHLMDPISPEQLAGFRKMVKLAFTNSSMAVPYGTIRNLHFQVGDCVFHTEFQVVEMRKDHVMPLIFGRSFMATVGAIVDMPNKRISFSNINKKVFYKAVPTRS
ncbi:hypothetical protein F2Q69_00035962 [Brassica cretica]|uniref:Aspartic peptidase DDI1-type domain-containing protein n=1 Tax=Brassica cretica TaxID=69181 RepID=A0A8S9SKU2_BRACR|nr:hypothetical protein F2Q69_00035962 [Brassica cretica]